MGKGHEDEGMEDERVLTESSIAFSDTDEAQKGDSDT